MNLVVDQGNTICKIALCHKDKLIKSYALPKLSLVEAKRIIERHRGLTGAIYSTVGCFDASLLRLLRDSVPYTVYLDRNTNVPISVDYNRGQLGSDRLAAAVAGYYVAPKGSEILIVDSGTAITFERISSSGLYLGGNISPGLKTRLKSLHHFTSKLPLVKNIDYVSDFGNDTIRAISNGVVRGLCYEIDGYIDELKKQYAEVTVILAGGNSTGFRPKLKNKVFVMRNLVVMGLNLILEYNKQLNRIDEKN